MKTNLSEQDQQWVDTQIATLAALQTQYDALLLAFNEEMAPNLLQIAGLKEGLANYALANKSTIGSNIAQVQYVKPATRNTWDAKGLEDYAKAHPEILAFKTVTTGEESTRFKWILK